MSTAPEQATKPSDDWSKLLLNKVVFVTGAGGAIGASIAQTCALHGARVAVAASASELPVLLWPWWFFCFV